jgi:hypothetical protein
MVRPPVMVVGAGSPDAVVVPRPPFPCSGDDPGGRSEKLEVPLLLGPFKVTLMAHDVQEYGRFIQDRFRKTLNFLLQQAAYPT